MWRQCSWTQTYEEQSDGTMLNQEDLDDFVLAQKAKSTSYKDTSDLNVFRRFCSTVKETREIENIPPAELDALSYLI